MDHPVATSGDLARLLPHRPPMLMIDALTSCAEDAATARKTFRQGDYGTAGERVLEPVLIECLAQTLAAMQGHNAQKRNQKTGFGMLVGVDDFVFRGAAQCGKELTLTVAITKSFRPFVLATGQVRQGDAVIAEGTLKVYLEEGGA